MNDADSKKLKEARKDYDDGRCLNAGGNYIKVLEAHIKEQNREIERSRERDKQVEIALLATRQQRDDEFNRAEKAEAETQQERINAEEWYLKAQEAEARIKAQDIVIAEYKADDYDEMQRLKARIEELEQEILWAVDACEKAENLLAEK